MNKIYGKKVILHKTTGKDLPDLVDLWNDGRVMKYAGFPEGLGYNLEKASDWFNKLQKEKNRHHFVVYSKDIGFCGEVYYKIDAKYKRAGLDIKFRFEAQGKGLASDALIALIEFIFKNEPDTDAVWTEPAKENLAAQKLYRRCGLTPQVRPKNLKGENEYWERKRNDDKII